MNYRIGKMSVLLLSLFVFSSYSLTSAVTCSGTLTFGSDDSTETGSICGNDANSTADSDDVYECLLEGSVPTGKSQLKHDWLFANLPAGTHYLIFEGNRPTNPDGDNFQFYKKLQSCTGFCLYNLVSGALINHVFEPVGGTKVSLNLSTEDEGENLLIRIRDTVVNGEDLATVNIDYLAVCTE